jgi:hypothetical protein
MAIRDEVLEELLAGYKKPEDLLGPEGLLIAADGGARRKGAVGGDDRTPGVREARAGGARIR